MIGEYMARKIIKKEIIKWLEAIGWEERPEEREDGKGSSLSFGYAAGGEYGLDCLLIADEADGGEEGMLTLVGTVRFSIPEKAIQEITDLCLHFRKDEGNLYFSESGVLNYIHARSIEALEKGVEDVGSELNKMLDEMSEYIKFLAPSIIGIVNGETDYEGAIKTLEKGKENMKNENFIDSGDISIEALKKVLDDAGFAPLLDDDQDLYVSNDHIEFGTFITFDADKNLLQFHTYTGVKPGVSEVDMYSFINSLNSTIARPQFFATGSESDGFYLYGRYFLSTQFGIDTKAFVTTLEKFAGAFMAGMRQDKDDIFFE